jgi:hypothetical protein
MSHDPLVKKTPIKKVALKSTCPNDIFVQLDKRAKRPKWGSFLLIFLMKKTMISCSESYPIFSNNGWNLKLMNRLKILCRLKYFSHSSRIGVKMFSPYMSKYTND